MKKSFEQWLKEVDLAIQAKVGLSHLDIDDAPYHDWYDAGISPKSAASKALKNAGLRS